jgi:hypothetical protein
MFYCAIRSALCAVTLASATGCTFISKATEFNGLPGPNGRPVEYVSATTVGVNLLFIVPLVGDASVPNTIHELTAKAKDDGATKVRIVQSGTSYLWYVLLPFSIFIHPVVTSVSADAEFVGPSAESSLSSDGEAN